MSIFNKPYSPASLDCETGSGVGLPPYPMANDVVPVSYPHTLPLAIPIQSPGPPPTFSDEYKRGWFDGYHAATYR